MLRALGAYLPLRSGRAKAAVPVVIAACCILSAMPVRAQTVDCPAIFKNIIALPGIVAPESRILLIQTAASTCAETALPLDIIADPNAQYEQLRTQIAAFRQFIQSERQAVGGSTTESHSEAEYYAKLQRFAPNPRQLAVDAISQAVERNMLASGIVAGTTSQELLDFANGSIGDFLQSPPRIVAAAFFQQLHAMPNNDQVLRTWHLLQEAARHASGDDNLRQVVGTFAGPFTSNDASALVQNVAGLLAIANNEADKAGRRAREAGDLELRIKNDLERLNTVPQQLGAAGMPLVAEVSIARNVQAIIGVAIRSPLPDRAQVEQLLTQLPEGSISVGGVNIAQISSEVLNAELRLRSLATESITPDEVFNTAASMFHINPQLVSDAQNVSSAMSTGTKVLSSVLSGNYLGAVNSLFGGVFSSDDGELRQLQKIDGDLKTLLDGQQQIISLQKQTLEAVENLSKQLEKTQREIEGDILFGYKLTAGLLKDRVAICQTTLGYADAYLRLKTTNPFNNSVIDDYHKCIETLTGLVNIPSSDPMVPDVNPMFDMQASGRPGIGDWQTEIFGPITTLVGGNPDLIYQLSDTSAGFDHLAAKLGAASPPHNAPLPVEHFAVAYNPDEVAWFSDVVIRTLQYYPIVKLNIGLATVLSSTATLDTVESHELLMRSLALVDVCIAQQSAIAGDALLPKVIADIRNGNHSTWGLVFGDDLLAKNIGRYLLYDAAVASGTNAQNYKSAYDLDDVRALSNIDATALPNLIDIVVIQNQVPYKQIGLPPEIIGPPELAGTIGAPQLSPFDPTKATPDTVLKNKPDDYYLLVPLPSPADFAVRAMIEPPVVAQLERDRQRMIELLAQVGYVAAPSDAMMSAITILSLP
jgi:hypothetical protein